MPSSHERLGVAELLREIGRGEHHVIISDVVDVVTGDWRASVEDFALALADLIDPTCEAEPMDDYVSSHAFSRWRCKSCGAVSFVPRSSARPHRCSYCGARFVCAKGPGDDIG